MDATTREFVRRRAGQRCEYCRLPQAAAPFFTFHVEHVRAKQHRGGDEAANLALACPFCSILFAVAEMEQQTRRERQAAGIAVAKRNGIYQGRKAGSRKADAARALALRSKGLNDTEIATALGVARQTVQRYLHA